MKSPIRRADGTISWLFVSTLVFIIMGVFSLAMAQVDGRQFLGTNLWFKPLKFAISDALFCFTFGLILNRAPMDTKKIKHCDLWISLIILEETFIIFFQAYRGVRSHFNFQSLDGELLWLFMAVSINYLTFLMAVITYAYYKSPRDKDPEMRFAVLTSSFLFIFVAASGMLMAAINGHAVGVPEGGAGLWFLNWSTRGGDLRIAHFAALHACQVLPLLAWALTKIRARNRLVIVKIASVSYGLFVALLFCNALVGRPL